MSETVASFREYHTVPEGWNKKIQQDYKVRKGRIKLADGIYIEENGVYQLDCTTMLWSTDQIYNLFYTAGTFLCDADFVAETAKFLLLIEYKNVTD